MHLVVMQPILEILFQAPPNFESPIGRHGHIAEVEQAMDICSQQQSVRDFVGAACPVRMDIGGVEDR
jgi:hypothetical protein